MIQKYICIQCYKVFEYKPYTLREVFKVLSAFCSKKCWESFKATEFHK